MINNKYVFISMSDCYDLIIFDKDKLENERFNLQELWDNASVVGGDSKEELLEQIDLQFDSERVVVRSETYFGDTSTTKFAIDKAFNTFFRAIKGYVSLSDEEIGNSIKDDDINEFLEYVKGVLKNEK